MAEPAGGGGEVATAPPAGPPAEGAAPAEQPQTTFQMIKTIAVRMFFIWFVMSLFRRGGDPNTSSTTESDGSVVPAGLNLFPKGTKMDLRIYISEEEKFTDFEDDILLLWLLEGVEYGDWYGGEDMDSSFYQKSIIPISMEVQNNGTLFIHVFLTKEGYSPNPRDKSLYQRLATTSVSKQINKFKKMKYQRTRNLLTGNSETTADLLKESTEQAMTEVISHWHPNITINIVDDHTPWRRGSVPSPLDEHVKFDPSSGNYFPVLYVNDYWNMATDYTPINETTPNLDIQLSFYPLSLFKWQMYAAQGMKNKWTAILGDDMADGDDEEQDSIKKALVDTNPYLLGLTFIVSIVHSIFEFLAFKNDIQFWRNRETLEGLSVRSVFFNVFQSLIVVLYVLDNETNTVVRISCFIGLLIEIWKISKTVNITIDRENRWFDIIPRVKISEKSTYHESPTKQYDMLAFRYLSWLLYPLLGCYAVYSLVYVEHRGWYSWVLGMLYGFLLTFGFIMMTPQLFINYKMKSVAHLPWRMLTYKALNTFIDDIFAFVIYMPTMYRIGCFRDDIVFFIYLYQRWIYRVDPKRMNEFGTSGEMHEQIANGHSPPPHHSPDTAPPLPLPLPLPASPDESQDTNNQPTSSPDTTENKKSVKKNKESKKKR